MYEGYSFGSRKPLLAIKKTYGRVNARVHKKVLVLLQESFNSTTISLQLRHFLLDVSQEERVGPITSKLPCMASACCRDPVIAVELTNSSATENHVVFQPTSEQAKYGSSGILKEIERFLQFSSEINNLWTFRWIEAFFLILLIQYIAHYCASKVTRRHTKLNHYHHNCFTNDT